VGIEPTTEDYELGAIGRTGLVASDWSEKLRVLRPVVLVASGGVGLVYGMQRGIFDGSMT
jgi:hypothetical protein